MEIKEHKLFQDIPGVGKQGKFHSSILTTFSVDLLHFDSHLRNVLRRKQVFSINIFADENQIDKSLEYVTPEFLHHVGEDYSLSSIRSVGAFHSKIYFLAGANSALVLIGSGNLTVGGHGKNHELFTGFMVDQKDNSQLPLIHECWRYLQGIVSRSGKYEQSRILKDIPNNCTCLEEFDSKANHTLFSIEDGLMAALLYHEEKRSILSQIKDIIPSEDITKITIASPYFDEKGDAIENFLDLFPNASIDVLIQKNCTLPPSRMKDNTRVTFYDFDATERGKQKLGKDSRLAHVKLMHFSATKSEYCVLGSANATLAGLGTLSNRGDNEEFCVLYQSNKMNILKSLGIKVSRKFSIPEIRSIERDKTEKGDGKKSSKIVHIKSADYHSGYVELHVDKLDEVLDDFRVVWNNGEQCNQSELHKGKASLTFSYTSSFRSMICYLCNQDGEEVSNKVFVNNLYRLEATNPAVDSRNVNYIISLLEEDKKYDELEISSLLADVIGNYSFDTEAKMPLPKSSSRRKEDDDVLPDIRYKAEYDNDEIHSSVEKIDGFSRLIDCIEDNLKKRLSLLDDESKGEEEEGAAEESNERTSEKQDEISVRKDNLNDYSRVAERILKSYIQFLKKRISSSNSYITKEDHSFFALVMFISVEICYLNRFKYRLDGISTLERSSGQKKLLESLDRCMEDLGMEALLLFYSLCDKSKTNFPTDTDFLIKYKRSVKYALLYAAFLYRYSSNVLESTNKGNCLIRGIRGLVDLYGIPESLDADLSCLSEYYQTFKPEMVYRFLHKKINDNPKQEKEIKERSKTDGGKDFMERYNALKNRLTKHRK